MTFQQYKEAILKNLAVMSRTFNGILDVSASSSKVDSMAVSNADEAEQTVKRNVDETIALIYGERNRFFKDAGAVSDFLIEIASQINKDIVLEGCLFRNGQDSDKYPYARIKDLDEMWQRFCREVYVRLTNPGTDAIALACFVEYIINPAAHFFSDGCGKISIMVSAFICMRYNVECPVYDSRESYYDHIGQLDIPTIERILDPIKYYEFVKYYRSLCKIKGIKLIIDIAAGENDKAVLSPNGIIDWDTYLYFSGIIFNLCEKNEDLAFVFDCQNLKYITSAGTDTLKKLQDSGHHFTLINANQDVYVALRQSDLLAHLENAKPLPQADISDCSLIGEGSNGLIYRLNKDLVIKVFKKEPDFDAILNERILNKNMILCGIPAPISFGYADVGGKLALPSELVEGSALVELFREDISSVEDMMPDYVALIKELHHVSVDLFYLFPHNTLLDEICEKVQRLKPLLGREDANQIEAIFKNLETDPVLLHGDIQPSNIINTASGLFFLDLETVSVGSEMLELGALWRTLHSIISADDQFVYNGFLKMTYVDCDRIWKGFFNEYYKGMDEEERNSREHLCILIGSILDCAKIYKTTPESPKCDLLKNLIHALL